MKFSTFGISILLVAASTGLARADSVADVTAAATAYFNAQNAHDLATVSAMLVPSEDLLVVRGPAVSWGRDAAIKQYEAIYKGVWKLETDGKPPKVVMVGESAAETFVPVTFTVGPKEGQTKQFTMNVTQVWVKTDGKWLTQSILATPLPQQ